MKSLLRLLLIVAMGVGVFYGLQYLRGAETRTSAQRVDHSAGDFTFVQTNDDGSPVTWDTCDPIDVLVETIGMPDGADAEIDEAVQRLVAATDLNLNYLGTTSGMHTQDWVTESKYYYPGQPPILFGWSPLDSDMPSEDAVGFALTTHTSYYDQSQIAGSVITIHTKRLMELDEGFPKGNSRGAVYMHELAHAFGLDHVPNSSQLMHDFVTPFNGGLTDGDIDGLNVVAAKMCSSS